jgi:hypothetical protein
MLKYKCIDRDITYSCMYLYVFFIRIKNDKLIYISSPFSNQGIPEVNEFLLIHTKPQCLHILKKSKISSGNSCNYCINNVQTLGLSVYKQKLINFRYTLIREWKTNIY